MINESSQYLILNNGIPASSAGVFSVTTLTSSGPELSSRLYLTRNGGASRTEVYETPFGVTQRMIQDMAFTSPDFASALVQTSDTASVLILTTNGGRTWHRSVP